MPQRLTYGDKLLISLSVLILLFVAASCAGAEWCRYNYYCGDAATQQYQDDCAAYGLASFLRNVWCWFRFFREDINALATAILALFTIVLAFAARRQAILTRDALIVASEHAGHMGDTVDIGKKQVRAYVTITNFTLRFAEFGVIQPNVEFTGSNSGQSPARNFLWNITLEYIVFGEIRRRRTLMDNWENRAGLDIPATNSAVTEGAFIPDMMIDQIQGITSETTVVTRIKIDFRYTDVFDDDWYGEAFFAGIAFRPKLVGKYASLLCPAPAIGLMAMAMSRTPFPHSALTTRLRYR
jgi:hypothetical protein